MQNAQPSVGGRRVEIISTGVLALFFLLGGRMMLQGLHRFAGPSVLMFIIIGAAIGATLARDIGDRSEIGRMRSTRNATALAAITLAAIAVGTQSSWSIGAAVVATEFALLCEILVTLKAAA